MKKIFDLRFVIGAFFLIVGLLLLVYHFTTAAIGTNVNLWCALVFSVFGVLMIALSYKGNAGNNDTV